jgi:class 3 adenylate cyclase
MSNAPLHYRWQWELNGTAKEIWQLLSSGNRFRALFSGTHEKGEPEQSKGKKSFFLGLMDAPSTISFCWVLENAITIEYGWPGDQVAGLTVEVRFQESSGTTVLHHEVTVEPKTAAGSFLAPFVFGKGFRLELSNMYAEVNDYLSNREAGNQVTTFSRVNSKGQARLEEVAAELQEEGFRPSWVSELVRAVSLEPDHAVESMSPLVLADRWEIPRKRTVEMMLSAAKKGILQLRWELRCPKCLQGHQAKKSLKDVGKAGKCPNCAISFYNNLSHNVELVFSPHSDLRLLNTHGKADTSPAATPFTIVHKQLSPQEIVTYDMTIAEGKYRIRSKNIAPDHWVTLVVPGNQEGEFTVEIGAESLSVNFLPKPGFSSVRIANRTNNPELLIVESLSWKQQMLTAAEAAGTQHFRRLFPGETLGVVDLLPTDPLTFLCIEIPGATQLLSAKGDRAFYLLLQEFHQFIEQVVDHHDGAVISHSSHKLLATFIDPEKGVRAAITINQDLDSFTATLTESERFSLRLAVHTGECLATDVDNHLGYFGNTVNKVSSLAPHSKGRDVVITSELAEHAAVRKLLQATTLDLELFETELLDYEGAHKLVRVKGTVTA